MQSYKGVSGMHAVVSDFPFVSWESSSSGDQVCLAGWVPLSVAQRGAEEWNYEHLTKKEVSFPPEEMWRQERTKSGQAGTWQLGIARVCRLCTALFFPFRRYSVSSVSYQTSLCTVTDCCSGLHLSFCSGVPDLLCLSRICFLLLGLCSCLSNSVLLL